MIVITEEKIVINIAVVMCLCVDITFITSCLIKIRNKTDKLKGCDADESVKYCLQVFLTLHP
jgi:hypothetical protein